MTADDSKKARAERQGREAQVLGFGLELRAWPWCDGRSGYKEPGLDCIRLRSEGCR